MTAAVMEDRPSKRGEIVIAIIGMIGVALTGIFSNWEKIFPDENVVEATYTGYRPTGNFETEFRYHIDVSGTRRMIESMQQQVMLNAKHAALAEQPHRAQEIERIFKVVESEAVKLDDVIRAMLPVYQKYFTLEEMQELNKFYSTKVMQSMTDKLPLVSQELAPVQVKMLHEYLARVHARIQEAQ